MGATERVGQRVRARSKRGIERARPADVAGARVDVIEALTRLGSFELPALNNALIRDSDLFCTVRGPDGTAGGRDLVCAGILDIRYHGTDDSKEVRRYPGIVAASPETLEAVNRVNTAKAELQGAYYNLVKVCCKDAERRRTTEVEMRREYLASDGWHDLHTLQATRALRVAKGPVLHAGFTVARHSSSWRKLSWAEVHEMIGASGKCTEDQRAEDLQLLFRNRKTQFVVMREVKPHWRVNVRYETGSGRAAWQMISCSMPVFYPWRDGDPPSVTWPAAGPEEDPVEPARQRGSDKTEDIGFQSVPVRRKL